MMGRVWARSGSGGRAHLARTRAVTVLRIYVALDRCVDHQEGIADDGREAEYVVSSTHKDFHWTNSHLLAGDLRTDVQKIKDETPAGVLLGGGSLTTALDRWELIDEYKTLVHPGSRSMAQPCTRADYSARDDSSSSRQSRSAMA